MIHTSIIIPCFNAEDKIGRCIGSLERTKSNPGSYEVIFVDDCSLDTTPHIVANACSLNKHWRFFKLDENSGSPSRPRNIGIDKAVGEYIFFLDCDDEIIDSAIEDLQRVAETSNPCIIRSELLAYNGREIIQMNRISEWAKAITHQERCRLIMRSTSTTVNSYIKRSLLIEENIRWPEELRMGEDTVFLAKALSRSRKIEYLSKPTIVYYKLPSVTPASTQQYGRRELNDHLTTWSATQAILRPMGIDYIKDRLGVGLRVALESIIFRGRGDVDIKTFIRLKRFVSLNWNTINSFPLSARHKEILHSILAGEYNQFKLLSRPRLLVAGHDLKFIKNTISELEKYFEVQIDEWSGHEIHDEADSKRKLAWAECIWCEWLLANAKWYSVHKRADQRLVIRMHRMELGRSFGDELDVENVDAVISVSALFFERLLERFPQIPRHKVRLIPNYIRLSMYDQTWHEDKLFTIGIIGILPARKGFHRALEILNDLHDMDKRFRLEVFGKNPKEVEWISRDVREMRYYNFCYEYIAQKKLGHAIAFNGHVDIAYHISRRRVGFVLSLSESEYGFPGPESFHLAIADGIAAASVSLSLNWPGVEYLWPKSIICKSQHELTHQIYKLSNEPHSFRQLSSDTFCFICDRYSVELFCNSVKDLFQELR